MTKRRAIVLWILSAMVGLTLIFFAGRAYKRRQLPSPTPVPVLPAPSVPPVEPIEPHRLGGSTSSDFSPHTMFGGLPIPWKPPARAAATANVSLTAMPVIQDGVTLTATQSVLLVGQTAQAQNGPYTLGAVIATDAGISVAALTRRSDFATSADAVPGSRVHVSEGTVYRNSDWYLQTAAPIVLGSTGLNWQRVRSGIYSVRDFGAVADWNGTTGTDDAPAFQNAINAACAGGPTGKGSVVDVSPGMYRLASGLTVPCAVLLRGDGHVAGGVNASIVGFPTLIKHYDASSTDDALITFNAANGSGQSSGGGLQGLRIVQAWNTPIADGGTPSSGDAIKIVATDNAHLPQWLKFSDLIIEESGVRPWHWGFRIDGSAVSEGYQPSDIYLRDIQTHTNDASGGMLYASAVYAMNVLGLKGSEYANVTLTGTSSARSAGIRLTDSQMNTLTLDYGDYPIVVGGSVGSVVVTAHMGQTNPGWLLGSRLIGSITDSSSAGFAALYYDKTTIGRSAGSWRFYGSQTLANRAWLYGIDYSGTTSYAMLGIDDGNALRILPFGDTYAAVGSITTSYGAQNGELVMANGKAVVGSGVAGQVVPLIRAGTTTLPDGGVGTDSVQIGISAAGYASHIQWGTPHVAPTGDAGAALGPIGGGPSSATQSGWLPVTLYDGTQGYMPVWK